MDRELVILGVFWALGNCLMFVLGFGASSCSLRGCFTSEGRVCEQWERTVLPHTGMGLWLLLT